HGPVLVRLPSVILTVRSRHALKSSGVWPANWESALLSRWNVRATRIYAGRSNSLASIATTFPEAPLQSLTSITCSSRFRERSQQTEAETADANSSFDRKSASAQICCRKPCQFLHPCRCSL